jgi:hypothetical protein
MHDAKWWEEQTRGMNFAVEDKLDVGKFNRVLGTGTMGARPYPTTRSGADLSKNRATLLDQWKHNLPHGAIIRASGADQHKPSAVTGHGE